MHKLLSHKLSAKILFCSFLRNIVICIQHSSHLLCWKKMLGRESVGKKKQEAHGPQLAHLSETATADGLQHFSNTVKYWNLWQGNGLNSFWDILLTRLKCWNFQNAISKKKFRYLSEVIWFIYLSCPLKFFLFCFFFPIFSSGNHFVQQSRTILAILAKGYKRNTDVKLFWNLATD